MREGLEDVLMISKCSVSHEQMEASLESLAMTSNFTEPHEDMEESLDYHDKKYQSEFLKNDNDDDVMQCSGIQHYKLKFLCIDDDKYAAM